MFSQIESSPLKESKKNISINFGKVNCAFGNPIKDVCISKSCTHKNAVLCDDQDCHCSLTHDACFRSQIRNIVKAIESRVGSFKKIQTQINKIFESAIDKLSDIQQKLIQNYRQVFQHKAYSPLESQFLESLKLGQCQNITGQLIFQINSNISKRQQLNRPITETSKQFQKISSQLMYKISQFGNQIEKPLKFVDMFFKSKVISTTKDKNLLTTFLPNKFQKAELLYRASQHHFSGEMFHKICDNVKSLLIVIKTKHGKVIGGYTPLAFPSTNRVNIVSDPKNGSFLFSLTEGDILPIKNSQYALINYSVGSDYIFSFGHDLKITNRANQNEKSLTSLGFSYENQFYSQYEESQSYLSKQINYSHDEEGWKKFTGSDKCFFGVVQWEVWKIINA